MMEFHFLSGNFMLIFRISLGSSHVSAESYSLFVEGVKIKFIVLQVI